MPTGAQYIYSAQKLEPFVNPELAFQENVRLDVSLNLVKGTLLGEKLGTNAKWLLTVSGSPTSGTFTVTYNAVASRSIDFNASASDVQSALEDTSTIGVGNVKVKKTTAGANPVWTVEFMGTLAAQTISLTTTNTGMTCTPSSSVTGAAGTEGLYKAYNQANTDGSQTAKCILPYDVQTDSNGLITISSQSGQAGMDQGQQLTSIPAYFGGVFKTTDLTGLDPKAIEDLKGRLTGGKPNGTYAQLVF